MTKNEYKKELYEQWIEKLKKDIEFYDKKALFARDVFKRGKWIGIRQYCEKTIKELDSYINKGT